jgi:GDP-L-fucose synthase
MDLESRIYVAGGDTLIGRALLRQLDQQGYRNVLGGDEIEPDLASGEAVAVFFSRHQPEYVFHAAGQSGGIAANQRFPADFCHDNLSINAHLLHAAVHFRVKRLLYLASSCCYPKHCPQPMQVDHLWSGPLEPTNEAYAAAKLAGVALCRACRQQHGADFIVGIPANVFGAGDDFDPQDGHVIPSLMHRLHVAKLNGDRAITIWGTGTPRREFLFADDLADACLFAMKHCQDTPMLNLGGGQDISIGELAAAISEVVGYEGRLEFDPSRPDGMPLKALDSTDLKALGWRPSTDLRDALEATYQWYLWNWEAPRLTHVG